MNGNSLARQSTGTSQANEVAKSTPKNAAKSAAKNALKNVVKNAVKHYTAEKQLFGICHDCSHSVEGSCWQPTFLTPFPRVWQCSRLSLSLSTTQPVVEHKAAECAERFHPPHFWCYSD